jgi:SAM-dependent methyltransferase
MARDASFGERQSLSALDRLGTFLSARKVVRALGPLEGRSIGDFGCGYRARLGVALLAKGARLLAVDLSLDPALESREGVRTLTGRLPDVLSSLESGSLDAALCISVLEHLDEPLELLLELRRLLVPVGLALVNVPTWRAKPLLEFSAFRLGLAPAQEMDDHRTYYDPRDLWPLLVRAGFLPHDIVCRRYKFGLNTFARCRNGEATQ